MSAPATEEVNTPPEYDDAPGTVTDPTTPDTHGAGNDPPPGADTDTVAGVDALGPPGSVTVNDTVADFDAVSPPGSVTVTVTVT